MSSTDAQPQLLPGISASAWRSVLRVLTWVDIVALLFVVTISAFHLDHSFSGLWFAPIFVVAGLLYVVVVVSGKRSKQE